MSESQMSKLRSQIASLGGDTIQIEFEDEQLIKAGFKDQEYINDVLSNISEGLIFDVEELVKVVSHFVGEIGFFSLGHV